MIDAYKEALTDEEGRKVIETLVKEFGFTPEMLRLSGRAFDTLRDNYTVSLGYIVKTNESHVPNEHELKALHYLISEIGYSYNVQAAPSSAQH